MLTLRTIRYGGGAAAWLLCLAGWLGGALPHGDLASTPVSVWQGPYGPLAVICWLTGTAGLAGAWWAARDRLPSRRWAVTTVLWWTAPFLVAAPTGSRDVYSYACQGHLFANGINPYEFGVASLPCPWIDAITPIWRDTPAPYGPLFLLLAAAAVQLAGSLTGVVVLLRLLAVAGVVAIALCLPVLARRCSVPVPRALWMALAGPVIGVHLVGGPHNDAVMIGLVVAALALLVAGSRHPAAQLTGGALLGLAMAVKITAVVVVPFAVLVVVGGRALSGPAVRAAGRVGGASVAAMVAVSAMTGLGVGWLDGMAHTDDLVQFTSPPTAVGMTLTYAGQALDPGFDAVPAFRLIALVLLAVVLVAIWVRSATTSGDPVRAALHGASLATVAVVVLAPSFHPWYAAFPLVLLAATTTRTSVVMAVAAVAPFLVLPDGGGLARFAKFPGAPLMTVLIVVLAVRYHRRRRDGRSVRQRPLEPEAACAGRGFPDFWWSRGRRSGRRDARRTKGMSATSTSVPR